MSKIIWLQKKKKKLKLQAAPQQQKFQAQIWSDFLQVTIKTIPHSSQQTKPGYLSEESRVLCIKLELHLWVAQMHTSRIFLFTLIHRHPEELDDSHTHSN